MRGWQFSSTHDGAYCCAQLQCILKSHFKKKRIEKVVFCHMMFLSCRQYLTLLNISRFNICLSLSRRSQKSTKTFSIESPRVVVHCSRASTQIYQKSISVKGGVVKGGVVSDVSAQKKSFDFSIINGQTVISAR